MNECKPLPGRRRQPRRVAIIVADAVTVPVSVRVPVSIPTGTGTAVSVSKGGADVGGEAGGARSGGGRQPLLAEAAQVEFESNLSKRFILYSFNR